MKIVELWVYPIKGLGGIRLDEADLGPRGIRYDRNFVICHPDKQGVLQKVQLSKYPRCALFTQQLAGDAVHVRFTAPREDGSGLDAPAHALQDAVLEVPLEPNVDGLERGDVSVMSSAVKAYRMGPEYDAWFTARFGFTSVLLYIGDGRRPVLGTFNPNEDRRHPVSSSIKSYLGYLLGTAPPRESDWLTFSDCAPYLVASRASLAKVSELLESGDMEMVKFRPNIVVDGEKEWDEDYWAQLSINGTIALSMSKMCNRCASITVDYTTGRFAEDEKGTILKKLMANRRVDVGYKYSPVFGRYCFLAREAEPGMIVSTGDEVLVTDRADTRPVWDWPKGDGVVPQFY